jgi:sugar/nucleoside kinase (ribokinase family)
MKKILGVGTALVDIIAQVDEEVIVKLGLNKGSMSLIEETQISQIRKYFNNPTITSGGSVCNTIHELNHSSHEASFFGKVNDDDYGHAFLKDMEEARIPFLGIKEKNSLPTGCCNILVTHDGERTMATHIGIGSQLSVQDINKEIFQGIDHVYMEAYLWDHDLTKAALKKVGELSKELKFELSFSLSDPFCVMRNRLELEDFISSNVDLVFCNLEEAKEFSQSEHMSDIAQYFQHINKKFVMTSGKEGGYFFHEGEVVHEEAKIVQSVVDTTGAGDNFAAGFLEKYLLSNSIKESLEHGHNKASLVIQQLGSRIKHS